MDEYASKLAEELSGDYTEATEALRNERSEPNPIRRLVAALTPLLGRKARTNIFSMVDSTLSVERPNGLARKRQTTRGTQVAGSERRQLDVRSLAFTDSVLDYLVHLHLLRTGNKPGIRSLSLRAFLDNDPHSIRLSRRYGTHGHDDIQRSSPVEPNGAGTPLTGFRTPRRRQRRGSHETAAASL